MTTQVPPCPKPGAPKATLPPRAHDGRQTGGSNAARRRAAQARRVRQLKIWATSAVAVVAAVVGLYVATDGGAKKPTSSYPYAVGQPGPGQRAPDFTLPSTAGGTWSLAAQEGKTVLLFFQEGIDCEPCWAQIKDIESDWAAFRKLGINEMVAITTDPLYALRQKVADEGITTPLLADPSVSVSNAYGMTSYAMAGMANQDGHSFVVVGPNGSIKWRADYGGAPDYTMYVPVPDLVAQMRAGGRGGRPL